MQVVAPEAPLPLQVAHVESHAAQMAEEISYWPMGHTYSHVPDVPLNVPPDRHDVQPVAVASLHAAQLLSHDWHVLSAPPNLPDGHEAKHAPPSEKGVPVAGHEVHAIEPSAEHSLHDEWQAMHVEIEPTVLTNVLLGHSSTHVPLETNGVLMFVQEMQSEDVPPLQVPQVGSHSSQTLDELANLPSGVQSATHVPRV